MSISMTQKKKKLAPPIKLYDRKHKYDEYNAAYKVAILNPDFQEAKLFFDNMINKEFV